MAQGFENSSMNDDNCHILWWKITLALNKYKGNDCLRHGWRTNLSNPKNARPYIKTD